MSIDAHNSRRVHLVISGRVQGVFFRAHTKEQADLLGITGWVKNLDTGQVEVVAEGESNAIDRFVDWCRQGPRLASVSRVEIADEPPEGNFSSFSIRY